MELTATALPGCFDIRTEPLGDDRGYFMRTFCARTFREAGLNPSLAQTSISYNRDKATLRGLHFQAAPQMEDKLVRCLKGHVFDVAVDLRPGSPTLGKWHAVELSEDNNLQIYIPKGFAHGYQTLTDDCALSYAISEFYMPDLAAGVRWDDPEIGIDWPLTPGNQSPRDKDLPFLADLDRATLMPFEGSAAIPGRRP